MRAGCAAADQPQPNSAFAALNQAPKAKLAAFGIENHLASPKADRLLGDNMLIQLIRNRDIHPLNPREKQNLDLLM